jgi:hypothetical protein
VSGIYQLKIDREHNTALLDLNAFFYPPKVIGESAAAFREACSVKHSRKGDRLLIEILPAKSGNAEEIALNFLNYALSVRKELR